MRYKKKMCYHGALNNVSKKGKAPVGLGTSYAAVVCFISPPKFKCWNPNPHSDTIGRWGLWEWLGDEGKVLMNGIRALIKEAPESSLALSV